MIKSKVTFHFYKQIFIYLSKIMLSSSKQSPSDTMHLCQPFFQSSKHFWNELLGIALSSSGDAALIFSIVVNLRPFMGLFNFRKRKKSQGPKSGEYGGWWKYAGSTFRFSDFYAKVQQDNGRAKMIEDELKDKELKALLNENLW